MDACKCIVPSRNGGALNSRWAASSLVSQIVLSPENGSKLRPTTGVHLALCRDEFRRPQSDTVRQAFSFGRLDCKNSPQSHIVRVYDAGHGKSGVFHSAEWHVGDWSSDGIREAWLRFFIWVTLQNVLRRKGIDVTFGANWEVSFATFKIPAPQVTSRKSRECRLIRSETLE
ncbi:hypothetical protein TNCV_2297811 [Trichonephila clavipes]|nr:hypothetical protein TNCV_2297811 [Trichonephila clavipes]